MALRDRLAATLDAAAAVRKLLFCTKPPLLNAYTEVRKGASFKILSLKGAYIILEALQNGRASLGLSKVKKNASHQEWQSDLHIFLYLWPLA
jgi:hypothetical protein